MATKRVEYDHRWYWEGKQDRYWYKHSYITKYVIDGVDNVIPPKLVEQVLGTVTRVSDTRSPHFNRWFAELYRPALLKNHIKSEPMLSRNDAKAWLEVIERMNRS